MDTAEEQERPALFIAMSGRQLVGTIGVGLVTGLLCWGLLGLLDTYVFKAIFCQAVINDQCSVSTQYASVAANILATGIAVFALVKLQVFRPLLVGLGTIISLWGLWSTVALLPWWVAMLLYGALFALAYVVFMWMARIRSFGMSLVIMVVLVVAVRFALNS